MSRWQALAYVRNVTDSDLRDRFTDAIEALQTVCDAVEYGPEPGENLLTCGDNLADEIAGLRATADEAEKDRDRAEGRLEEKLQDENDTSTKEQLAEITSERDELKERLASIEIQSEAYSDALAMARRFVSVGTKAGTPVKHVRAVRSKRAS